MSKQFRGSYTVAVTPFTKDSSQICTDSLRRFLDWQIECGVPGIILLGTTGEFLTVSEDERKILVGTTVEHVNGRMDVMVGSMNAHTPIAVRYSREAEDLGADGLMIIPPYYYTPTEDEIYAYYRAISVAVSIPIMLYNNPFTSNIDMPASLITRISKEFDNIRYIKEASMDLGRIFDIVEDAEGTMNVFAGERPVESYLLGAVGYVNPFGNYIPYSTSKMWDLMLEGRIEEAKEIQHRAEAINTLIGKGHPMYGHQCYSKALAAAAGYPMGDVRLPLTRFDQLGQEGADRRDQLVVMMKEVEALAQQMGVTARIA
jgi:4-hydroxy-tetrahydrodipicolinate synthase